MTAGSRRVLLIAVLGAGLAGVLYWAFRPQPVLVDMETAEQGAVRETIEEEGFTRVRDVFTVSAPVAGRVQRISLEVGDTVAAGDQVAALEPPVTGFLDARARAQAEAEVRAAMAARDLAAADIERARAQLTFAEAEVKRLRRLVSQEAATQRALELAETEVKARHAGLTTAEAALRVQEYRLETAKAQLLDPALASPGTCCVPVPSPIDGVLLRILQESEAVVAAGTPLVEIGDPTRIEVVAELLTSDAVRLPVGAEVELTGWGGDTLAGRVRRVEPYGFRKISALGVEERRVEVIVDIVSPREAYRRLAHGYRLDLTFILRRRSDVVIVPVGAVFRMGEGWAVFVVEDGRATPRQVEIGISDRRRMEIRKGLEPGEFVVVHPGDQVEAGVSVVARAGRP